MSGRLDTLVSRLRPDAVVEEIGSLKTKKKLFYLFSLSLHGAPNLRTRTNQRRGFRGFDTFKLQGLRRR
jgi:hypothetical protein